MELIKYISPNYDKRAIDLWAEIFGESEAKMEEIQLNGSEAEHNTDILITAQENDAILGTIHATIPMKTPSLCALSGMCTTTAARGKGVGRILFSKILDEIDSLGVKVSVLGTSNPIGSKLYASLGFRYLSGSHIMVRYLEGDTVDYIKNNYSIPSENISIVHNSPAIRVPMIPLIAFVQDQLILDINAGIICSNTVTQKSCMGLYPKYETIAKNGGDFYACFDDNGILGAIITSMPTSKGLRTDFFALDGFWDILPEILVTNNILKPNTYFEITELDRQKIKIIEDMGYTKRESSIFNANPIMISTNIYR